MVCLEWVRHYLSVLNQILLHYYTSLLFIWGWGGGGSSLKGQLPDYCPILLRAPFCWGVLITAVFGTINPFPTISFPRLSLEWILFIPGQNNQGQPKSFCSSTCYRHFWATIQGSPVFWSEILGFVGYWECWGCDNLYKDALSLYSKISFFPLSLSCIDLKSSFRLYFFKKILKINCLKCL